MHMYVCSLSNVYVSCALVFSYFCMLSVSKAEAEEHKIREEGKKKVIEKRKLLNLYISTKKKARGVIYANHLIAYTYIDKRRE